MKLKGYKGLAPQTANIIEDISNLECIICLVSLRPYAFIRPDTP